MEAALQMRFERVEGVGRAVFGMRGARSVLQRLHQSGSAKILMPRRMGHEAEAVLVNTAGGLTGGDGLRWEAEAGAGAFLTVTTPAAEKAYRCAQGEASICVRLVAGDGARLHWMPQETILFECARLARRMDVALEGSARLLMAETVMFGRSAMGEVMTRGLFRDRWRVARDGRLIHAEETRVDPAEMHSAALGAGAVAMGFVLYCADDAEEKLDAVRAHCACGGATAFGGKLMVRLLGTDGLELRRAMARVLGVLRAEPLPRLWFC